MTNQALIIKTIGADTVISDKRAKDFGKLILPDIKAYLAEHQAEYQEWLNKNGEDR